MQLLIVWMSVIFLFSSIPDLSILHLDSWSAKPHLFWITSIDWNLVFSLNNPFFSFPNYNHLDTILHKVGHMIVFSILGVLAFRATQTVARSVRLCTFYAFFDEIHQSFVPGRSGRIMDVVLDVALACAAIWILSMYRNSARKPKLKRVLTES